MRFAHPIPVLRSLDEAQARAFYLGYLGFRVDWEHRFEAHMPLYMQLRLGDCVIHLSEHRGDATPGGAVRIECDLMPYFGELAARSYPGVNPSVIEQPWGMRELFLTDPFGNRIIFFETLPHD